ncbi:MAGE [Carabus blaptoides fortunei]
MKSQSVNRYIRLNKTVEIGYNSQSDKSPAFLVDQCVRYMLLNMKTDIPISKSNIQQNVLLGKNPGMTFTTLIAKATDIMRNVYGLEIDILDYTANKKYVVSSLLSNQELIDNPIGADMKATITFLVLAHIFMSKNQAKESSLWSFLELFKITASTELEDIGNVHEFVTKTMFKQQYIMYSSSSNHHSDNFIPKKKLSWGPHAEETVSKMEILKFYTDLFNSDPTKWLVHYEMAQEQTFFDPKNPTAAN